MKDKYIFDSSVWIEIERKNPLVLKIAQPLIDGNALCVVDVITAELLRGVKTRRDFRLLQEAFSDFPQLSTSWEKVADLGFRVAKKGYHPPLIDLYIAQCTWENKKTLLTHDRHFSQIAKIQPFKLELLQK